MTMLGLDVGGSKTRLVVIDKGGKPLVIEGEGANPAVVGLRCVDIISELLRDALARAKVKPEEVEIVGIGSAGVGKGFWRELFAKALELSGIDPGKMELFEDFRTAYTACFLNEPGVVAISGTGSSIYGECRGLWVKVGGWGHLIDDGGSAYQVGRDGIAAALMYYDGRSEETVLLRELLEYLGIENPELAIPKIYGSSNPKKLVAGFAPRVVKAAMEGDKVAKSILSAYCKHLAIAIGTAIRRLRSSGCIEDLKVAVVGGFWKFVEKLVLNDLVKELENSVGRVELKSNCIDPACGALVRALVVRGKEDDARNVFATCRSYLPPW